MRRPTCTIILLQVLCENLTNKPTTWSMFDLFDTQRCVRDFKVTDECECHRVLSTRPAAGTDVVARFTGAPILRTQTWLTVSTPVRITICVYGKYSPVTVVDRCSVGPEEVALRRMRERALVELVVREPDPARIRETRVVRPLPGV